MFVVDVMNGLTDLDTSVANMLRRTDKPVVVVSNKADNFDLGHQSAEFYSLGLGDLQCIVDQRLGNGRPSGPYRHPLLKDTGEEELEDIPKFAVVEDQRRQIVYHQCPYRRRAKHRDRYRGHYTPILSTPRYTKFGMDFYLIDTAGIRKRGR